jgi:GDP-L-fucose synthase
MSAPNENLLITGAAGMLGSTFVKYFTDSNRVLFTPTSKELDLRDRSATHAYFCKNKITEVVHCAARVGGISANIQFPLDYILENLLIDSSVIDAAAKNSVKKFLYVGSSCMYPKDHDGLLSEEDILSGKLEPTNEGYALAKLSAAHAVVAAGSQYKVDWKVIIPSNLYGPGDSLDLAKSHLIPSIIMKLLDAKWNHSHEVEIWGDGTAKREFTFVEDVAHFVAANWELIDTWPDFMNVGIGMDRSVQEYYEMVAKEVGYKGCFKFNTDKPTGMKRKLMNSSRARQYGWNPQTSYHEGIKRTVAWYINKLEERK